MWKSKCFNQIAKKKKLNGFSKISLCITITAARKPLNTKNAWSISSIVGIMFACLWVLCAGYYRANESQWAKFAQREMCPISHAVDKNSIIHWMNFKIVTISLIGKRNATVRLLTTDYKNLITVYTQWNPIIAHENYFCVVRLNKGKYMVLLMHAPIRTRTLARHMPPVDPIKLNAGEYNHGIYGWCVCMYFVRTDARQL